MDASVHEVASTAYIAVSPPQLARRSITACPRLVCGTLVDYVSTHVSPPLPAIFARDTMFRYSIAKHGERADLHATHGDVRTTLVLQTGSVGGAPAGPARMIAADKRVFMPRPIKFKFTQRRISRDSNLLSEIAQPCAVPNRRRQAATRPKPLGPGC